MDIATGQPESHPTPLPLDASHSPGLAPPGTVSGPARSDAGGVMPTAAMFAGQAAAGEADVRAAQAAGMDARTALTGHYQENMAYGDAMALPPVPDNAVPPASSDLYPYGGDEPTPTGGPYGGDEPQ